MMSKTTEANRPSPCSQMSSPRPCYPPPHQMNDAKDDGTEQPAPISQNADPEAMLPPPSSAAAAAAAARSSRQPLAHPLASVRVPVNAANEDSKKRSILQADDAADED